MSRDNFIRRHPLAAYFSLAYLISWAIWSPLVTAALGWTRTLVPSWFHYLGAVGPVAAALIVAGVTEGGRGTRTLLGHLARWRIGWAWWLIAALGPFAAFVLASAIVRLGGAPWPAFSRFGITREFPGMGLLATFALYALTFGGLGEETGWRGFALPRLQTRRGALAATAWLTIGWAVWHWPAFLYREVYRGLAPGMVFGFVLSMFVGAILLTWLFNSSGGSLLPILLFHSTINVAYQSEIARPDIVMVMSVLFTLGAVLVVVFGGPQNLARRPRMTAPLVSHSGLRAAA